MKLRPSISLITGISAGLLFMKAVNVTLDLHRLSDPVHQDLLILLAVLLLIGGMSAAACVGFLRKAPWTSRYWILTCVVSAVGLLIAALWLGLGWGYPIYALAVAVVWFRESQETGAAA